eukprot:Ihof_evm1s630 gene=Ihof_evmTU1s630
MTLFATILSPVLTKLGERDDVYSLAANNVLDTFRQVEELVPGIAQKFMISLLEREHIALNSCTYQNAAPPPIPLTPLPPTSTHLPSSPHLLHYSTPITYPPSGSSLIGDAEVSSSSHCQPLLMEETVLLPPCDGTPSLSSNRSSTSDFKEPIADSAAVTMPMNNDSNLPQPCAQPLTSPIAPPKFAQSHLADKIKDRSRSNSVVVAEGNIWKDEDIPVADLSPNMDAKLVDVENHCLLLCTQLKSFSRNIVNEDLLMGSIPNIVSAIKLLITSMSVALDQAPKICISDSQRLDLSTSRKALISSSRLLCVAIKEHLSVPDSSSIIDCSHNLG